MSDISATQILAMVAAAERIGAFKALDWILFNLDQREEVIKKATVDDVARYVDYCMTCLNEQIVNDFKTEAWIFRSFEDLLEKRGIKWERKKEPEQRGEKDE